jgi:multimeric flavodoxin WrbA
MRLILSDRPMEFLPNIIGNDTRYFDLSALKIANCVGCFGCWTKTPGKCVIRDDAVKVYPYIAKGEQVLYISRVKFGGYDTVMKTMLERAIPVQTAFIRLLHGETHHVQRDVKEKKAEIIAYGDVGEQEKAIFTRLIERNAYNMNFKTCHITFVKENQLEETVRKEVESWENL